MAPTTPEGARSERPTLIRAPFVEDGARIWRLARDSETLDLNSVYAYVLWARDFAATSRIAFVDGVAAGFIIGYRRPTQPDCLFIWQVAVDAAYQGQGLAGRMLVRLVEEQTAPSIRTLQTTITDDNEASQQLFRGFARRWDNAPVTVTPLFESHHFEPDTPSAEGTHAPERLYEIGPRQAT